MQILSVIIFCIAVVGVSAIGMIMFSIWIDSRETTIEPIVVSKRDYHVIQENYNQMLFELAKSTPANKEKIWSRK